MDPETGKEEYIEANPRKKSLKLLASNCISFACCAVTVACAVFATMLKARGKDVPDDAGLYGKNKWKIISSICNLMIIQVFGRIYELLAQTLTEWENHRTRSERADAVIVKNFSFQFINNYFVLFYICYMRPFLIGGDDTRGGSSDGSGSGGGERPQSALSEIQFQLLVVFTGKTLGARAMEVHVLYMTKLAC